MNTRRTDTKEARQLLNRVYCSSLALALVVVLLVVLFGPRGPNHRVEVMPLATVLGVLAGAMTFLDSLTRSAIAEASKQAREEFDRDLERLLTEDRLGSSLIEAKDFTASKEQFDLARTRRKSWSIIFAFPVIALSVWTVATAKSIQAGDLSATLGWDAMQPAWIALTISTAWLVVLPLMSASDVLKRDDVIDNLLDTSVRQVLNKAEQLKRRIEKSDGPLDDETLELLSGYAAATSALMDLPHEQASADCETIPPSGSSAGSAPSSNARRVGANVRSGYRRIVGGFNEPELPTHLHTSAKKIAGVLDPAWLIQRVRNGAAYFDPEGLDVFLQRLTITEDKVACLLADCLYRLESKPDWSDYESAINLKVAGWCLPSDSTRFTSTVASHGISSGLRSSAESSRVTIEVVRKILNSVDLKKPSLLRQELIYLAAAESIIGDGLDSELAALAERSEDFESADEERHWNKQVFQEHGSDSEMDDPVLADGARARDWICHNISMDPLRVKCLSADLNTDPF